MRVFTKSDISNMWGDIRFVPEADAQAEIARLTAERDEARAQVAVAYEVAAKVMDDHGDSAASEALGRQLCCSGQMCGCQGADVGSFLQYLIRALTPADASTALAARDAAMRNEGRRQAARLATDTTSAAILATLEPEGGDGQKG